MEDYHNNLVPQQLQFFENRLPPTHAGELQLLITPQH